jgi:hypothetical protein
MKRFTSFLLTFIVLFPGFYLIISGQQPLIGAVIVVGCIGVAILPPLIRELQYQRAERRGRKPEAPRYNADGTRDYTPHWVRHTRAQMNRYDQTHDFRNEREWRDE